MTKVLSYSPIAIKTRGVFLFETAALFQLVYDSLTSLKCTCFLFCSLPSSSSFFFFCVCVLYIFTEIHFTIMYVQMYGSGMASWLPVFAGSWTMILYK